MESTTQSIYDVIELTMMITKLSQSESFEFEIDDSLKHYELEGIGNGVFSGIILNHVKNSLEASSSKIKISVGNIDNTMTIYVADNGNGISDSVKQKIFDSNFSTKKENSILRGNGLFVNKFILENSAGRIRLVDSSESGTIFCLTVPVRQI